jgi:hypothetical protein
MKKILLYISIVLVLVFSLSQVINVQHVRAPELFGDGKMYSVRVSDNMIGYIGAWGGWVIYGRESDCRIVQVSGAGIDGADGKIPCFMNSNTRFSGWIDFRGQRRKFCGAPFELELPAKCYGE